MISISLVSSAQPSQKLPADIAFKQGSRELGDRSCDTKGSESTFLPCLLSTKLKPMLVHFPCHVDIDPCRAQC